MPELNSRADTLKLAFYATPPTVGISIPLLAPLRTLPGVNFGAASHRNGPGKGLLRSEADGTALSWRAPGSTVFGTPVIASVDGDYLLEDGSDPGRYLQAHVKTGYLAPAPVEQAVYLQDRWNLIFPDLTAAEAASGTTAVVALELRNVGSGSISNIRAWIEPGNADLSISGDGAAYSAPTTEAASIALGTLAAGASRRFWAKRIIAPGAAANSKVFAGLHFRFDGV